jgi:2,4-dienoyl-CoA reductase-like NADH-dependent reductase (Old Yellow Enzyme family)
VSKILDLWKMGSYELNNRIIMAPMTRSRSDAAAMPSDLVVEYYRQRPSHYQTERNTPNHDYTFYDNTTDTAK